MKTLILLIASVFALTACEPPKPKPPMVEAPLVPSPSMTILGVTLGESNTTEACKEVREEKYYMLPFSCRLAVEVPDGFDEYASVGTIAEKIEKVVTSVSWRGQPMLEKVDEEYGLNKMVEKFGPPHLTSDGVTGKVYQWEFSDLLVEYKVIKDEYSTFFQPIPTVILRGDITIQTPHWVEYTKSRIAREKAERNAELSRKRAVRL